MRDRCRWHRRNGVVVGLRAAERIIAVLLRLERDREAVAVVWLDRRQRVLDNFVVRAAAGKLEEVAAPVIEARGSPVAAVVLGSSLPERRARPGKAEQRRFVALEKRHAEVGVELLDWFVMDRRWELWSLRQSFDR